MTYVALHGPHDTTGFPPYNIRKDGDYNFVIELALAGMSKDDLEVEVADQTLTVRSIEKKKEEGGELVASRYFLSTIQPKLDFG